MCGDGGGGGGGVKEWGSLITARWRWWEVGEVCAGEWSWLGATAHVGRRTYEYQHEHERVE